VTPVTSTSSKAGAVAALSALLLAAGCGGEDDAQAQTCRDQAYNAAEAAVVAEFYEQGKLGSRAKVEKQLAHDGMQFFDEDGRLVPYERLDADEQTVFLAWMNTGRVDTITYKARQEAHEQTEPDC
jgi:hypothetical protein